MMFVLQPPIEAVSSLQQVAAPNDALPSQTTEADDLARLPPVKKPTAAVSTPRKAHPSPADAVPSPVHSDPDDRGPASTPSDSPESAATLPKPVSIAPPAAQNSIYLQNAGIAQFEGTIDPADGRRSTWRDIAFLDGRVDGILLTELSYHLSARANLSAGDDAGSDVAKPFRLDLREAFLSFSSNGTNFLDVGRINQRFGVAYGYNPLDVFRFGANVDPLTGDPSVLRESRLGTLLVREQHFWTTGQVSVEWSPRVSSPRGLLGQPRQPPLGLQLGRVNAANRFVVSVQHRVTDNLRPEFVLFDDGRAIGVGGDATAGIGSGVVAYVEAAVARRRSLVAEAVAQGVDDGDLPQAVLWEAPLPGRAWRPDAVIGANVTVAHLSAIFEYHYDGVAPTRPELEGAVADPKALASMRLRYAQLYASVANRTTARQTAFARLAKQDAFARSLELSALCVVDLQDGSAYAQAIASYEISRRDRIGLSGSKTFGGRPTSFGSTGQTTRVIVSFQHYL